MREQVRDRAFLRSKAAELLKAGETPETVRNIIRSMGTDRKCVNNIVADTMQRLRIEDDALPGYEPPHVDTTGLVQWSDGHWADPRSAQLIREARKII